MTSAELRSLLPTPGWLAPFFYDGSYARVTNDWLFNKFTPWFIRDRKQRQLGTWSRKNDCDNAARTFCVLAQDAHVNTDQPDEAVAVGEFCYIASTHVQGPHAIVLAVTEDGVVFLEPQDGRRLTLSPTEIQTCFRVSF